MPTVASLGTLPNGLPQLGLPQVPFNLETLGVILPTALAISLVGLMAGLTESHFIPSLLG